jgi:hypothetical protein
VVVFLDGNEFNGSDEKLASAAENLSSLQGTEIFAVSSNSNAKFEKV